MKSNDTSSDIWTCHGEMLLSGRVDPEEQRRMLDTVKTWPNSLRRVEAVGQSEADPWWEYGRAPGAVDFLRLVRVLVLDVSNWTSLPANCRWRAGGADGVRELDIRQASEPDEAGALVAELPLFSRLKLDHARRIWHPLGVSELAVILHGLRTPLAELRLQGTELGAAGAELLVQVPLLEELTCLDLALTNLGDDGARTLGSWQCSNLQRLSVRGCGLTTGPLAWRRSPLLRNVVDLELSLNSLTTRAFEAVIESAPRLARLVLTESQIEPELLGRATHACLRELDISRSVVGDWLFQELLESLGRKLDVLIAQGCDVTDESVSTLLVALPRLRLREIDLRDNSFSEAGRRMLRAHAEKSGVVIAC